MIWDREYLVTTRTFNVLRALLIEMGCLPHSTDPDAVLPMLLEQVTGGAPEITETSLIARDHVGMKTLRDIQHFLSWNGLFLPHSPGKASQSAQAKFRERSREAVRKSVAARDDRIRAEAAAALDKAEREKKLDDALDAIWHRFSVLVTDTPPQRGIAAQPW